MSRVHRAYVFWFPQVVRYNDGHIPRSMEDVGLINSVPSSIGAVASLAAAFTSDRTGDRIIHATLGNFLQALGMALTGLNIQRGGRAPAAQLSTFTVTSLGGALYGAGSIAYEGWTPIHRTARRRGRTPTGTRSSRTGGWG